MIKLENTEVMGWEAAIRGMRNPMNSWGKTDSNPGCEIVTGSHEFCKECDHAIDINGNIACDNGNKPDYVLGWNDYDLMKRLRNAGTDHRKYLRMITVYVDITAPLYWWKEFDTYKIGTVANSCSTMHKITSKPFAKEDFSYEHLCKVRDELMTDFNEFIGIENKEHSSPYRALNDVIEELNQWRDFYIYYKNKPAKDIKKHNENLKTIWWQMIQLLPSSYNQKRTVMLNYEVLANMYKSRKGHKLDEWKDLCTWVKALPYSELITGDEVVNT